MRGQITPLAILSQLTGILKVIITLKDYLFLFIMMGIFGVAALDALYTIRLNPVNIFFEALRIFLTLPSSISTVKTPLVMEFAKFVERIPLLGGIFIKAIDTARLITFFYVCIWFTTTVVGVSTY